MTEVRADEFEESKRVVEQGEGAFALPHSINHAGEVAQSVGALLRFLSQRQGFFEQGNGGKLARANAFDLGQIGQGFGLQVAVGQFARQRELGLQKRQRFFTTVKVSQ